MAPFKVVPLPTFSSSERKKRQTLSLSSSLSHSHTLTHTHPGTHVNTRTHTHALAHLKVPRSHTCLEGAAGLQPPTKHSSNVSDATRKQSRRLSSGGVRKWSKFGRKISHAIMDDTRMINYSMLQLFGRIFSLMLLVQVNI